MRLKGLNRYQHFGFRQEWLNLFFEHENDFWDCNKLGKYQFDGFRVWLREAELTEDNAITELGRIVKGLGAYDSRVWAIILNNIAYNSTLFRWYVKNIDFGERYEVNEIIKMLGNEHSNSTKKNAVSSLKETFKSSPIGLELGAGKYDKKGNSIIAITRAGWNNPEPIVILYSLFKFAENSKDYYQFTYSELINDHSDRESLSPAQIFGTDKTELKKIIEGLSFDYSDFISVAFNKDLDNISLNNKKNSLDVARLLEINQ